MSQIEVKNLYKIFGKKPQEVLEKVRGGLSKDDALARTGHTVGIDDVSLEVEEGETFVVMGLSGSGKSTMIRCLNRLIEPTAGEILIDGVDIVQLNKREMQALRREKMGMVFQHFALLPHRSVVENVAYGLKLQGFGKEDRQARAREWIDLVGLKGYEDARPTALSGGMQQRVGLARALTTDPEILLMDEAFSALDPLIRTEMQDELIRLQQELHKTIVFITHDLDEALRLGDRVAILKDGRLVQVGTPEQIITEPADDYVEAFVRNVDRSRVLTARLAMAPAHRISVDTKPGTLLGAMPAGDPTPAYVTDTDGKYLGLVTRESLREGSRRGESDLRKLISEAAPTAPVEAPLNQLFSVTAASEVPVAVLRKDGSLAGLITHRGLLGTLAGGDGGSDIPGVESASEVAEG